MKVINEEPLWSPYPTHRTPIETMKSIAHDASFFMATCPGDSPNTDDEETTDIHVVNTRKASLGTMATLAVSPSTRMGPPIPTRAIDDLISDGVPLPIGREEPKKPLAPPSGSTRYGERESARMLRREHTQAMSTAEQEAAAKVSFADLKFAEQCYREERVRCRRCYGDGFPTCQCEP